MIRFTILLSILFTLGISLHAQPETLMQQLTVADVTNNADLYYDLGVDFYSAGEQGYANLCWLKALNLNSAHSQARANLELSHRLSPDYPLYPAKPFLIRVIFQFSSFFSVNLLAIFSLILLFLTALCLLWLLTYDASKERALPIMMLSLLIILTGSAFIALGIKYYRQLHNDQAVIIQTQTSLYDASGKTPVLDIHSGLVLEVIRKEQDEWLVRLPNGQSGRVSADAVRAVKE